MFGLLTLLFKMLCSSLIGYLVFRITKNFWLGLVITILMGWMVIVMLHILKYISAVIIALMIYCILAVFVKRRG